MNENKQELLEVYKLHATLADNVTKHRGRSNALFLTLQIASAFLYVNTLSILDTISIYVAIGLITMGLLFGIGMSIMWWRAIDRYRKLNQAKFQCLSELEQQLSYNFFEKEWQIYKSKVRGAEITQLEGTLPIACVLVFVSICVVLIHTLAISVSSLLLPHY